MLILGWSLNPWHLKFPSEKKTHVNCDVIKQNESELANIDF